MQRVSDERCPENYHRSEQVSVWIFPREIKFGSREVEFLQSSETESPSGRPELPVPNKPYGFCGRKATLKRNVEFWTMILWETFTFSGSKAQL